jgi:hypothetical protein
VVVAVGALIVPIIAIRFESVKVFIAFFMPILTCLRQNMKFILSRFDNLPELKLEVSQGSGF